MSDELNPNMMLPMGTQVVTRVPVRDGNGVEVRPRELVGVIVGIPEDNLHSYRVRFPDGTEAMFRRHELRVCKLDHAMAVGEEARGMLHEYDLQQYVIYRCIVESRAFGLASADSDEDRRGIYLPPASLHWSIFGVPEQLENPDTDECYWELQNFLTLALKANPNVLECLYTPLVEYANALAKELLEMRSVFLSKMIYKTYNGYAMSQFKKIEQDIRNHGEVRWKHAMHLVRLLLSGTRALREKTIPVDVGENRERLLSIRGGQMPWPEVNAWRKELHREFEKAYGESELPDRPDYQQANEFLVRARKSMV